METSPYADRPAVAVIANPISGRGRARRGAEELARALEQTGTPVELMFTAAAGDAPRLAAELPPHVGRVVAVGGDGTVREVVQGLGDLGVAVGMLPTGTANLLAGELDLPRDVEGCARVVRAGHTVRMDLARAGERRFFLVAGVGFDAAVVRTLSAGRTGPIRMSTYVGPVLKTLARFRHPHLTVEVEGQDGAREVHHDVLTAIIGNVRSYGGPFELTSYAHRSSRRLDVLLLRGRQPQLCFPAIMVAGLFRIAPLLPGSTYHTAQRVQVTAAEPTPFQLDGDYMGETPLAVEMEAEQLRMLAPLGPHSD